MYTTVSCVVNNIFKQDWIRYIIIVKWLRAVPKKQLYSFYAFSKREDLYQLSFYFSDIQIKKIDYPDCAADSINTYAAKLLVYHTVW